MKHTHTQTHKYTHTHTLLFHLLFLVSVLALPHLILTPALGIFSLTAKCKEQAIFSTTRKWKSKQHLDLVECSSHTSAGNYVCIMFSKAALYKQVKVSEK